MKESTKKEKTQSRIDECRSLIGELIQEKSDFLKVTFMKPGEPQLGKGGKVLKGSTDPKETTEVIFFDDMEKLLAAVESLRGSEGATKTSTGTWSPKEDGGAKKEIVDEINSRLEWMSKRKEGNVARSLAIAALESDPKGVTAALYNVPGVAGDGGHPKLGEKYTIPPSLMTLADMKVDARQGAVGKGEFVAVLMFGDRSGGGEPDLITPDGHMWSVKESKTPSQGWFPSSGDDVNKYGMQKGPEIYAALKSISSEVIGQVGPEKKTRTALIDLFSRAGFDITSGEKIKKTYKLQALETLSGAGGLGDIARSQQAKRDLTKSQVGLIERAQALIEKTGADWSGGKIDLSQHNVLVLRGDTLNAVSSKDLELQSLQADKQPKIAWVGK